MDPIEEPKTPQQTANSQPTTTSESVSTSVSTASETGTANVANATQETKPTTKKPKNEYELKRQQLGSEFDETWDDDRRAEWTAKVLSTIEDEAKANRPRYRRPDRSSSDDADRDRPRRSSDPFTAHVQADRQARTQILEQIEADDPEAAAKLQQMFEDPNYRLPGKTDDAIRAWQMQHTLDSLPSDADPEIARMIRLEAGKALWERVQHGRGAGESEAEYRAAVNDAFTAGLTSGVEQAGGLLKRQAVDKVLSEIDEEFHSKFLADMESMDLNDAVEKLNEAMLEQNRREVVEQIPAEHLKTFHRDWDERGWDAAIENVNVAIDRDNQARADETVNEVLSNVPPELHSRFLIDVDSVGLERAVFNLNSTRQSAGREAALAAVPPDLLETFRSDWLNHGWEAALVNVNVAIDRNNRAAERAAVNEVLNDLPAGLHEQFRGDVAAVGFGSALQKLAPAIEGQVVNEVLGQVSAEYHERFLEDVEAVGFDRALGNLNSAIFLADEQSARIAAFQDFAITDLQEARELGGNVGDAERWAAIRAVLADAPERRELEGNMADAERWAEVRAVIAASPELREMVSNRLIQDRNDSAVGSAQEYAITQGPERRELEANWIDAHRWAWINNPEAMGAHRREIEVAATAGRQAKLGGPAQGLYDALFDTKLRAYNVMAAGRHIGLEAPPPPPELLEEMHRATATEFQRLMNDADVRYQETVGGYDPERSLYLPFGASVPRSYELSGKAIDRGKDVVDAGVGEEELALRGNWDRRWAQVLGEVSQIKPTLSPQMSTSMALLTPAVSGMVGGTNALIAGGNYSERELEAMADVAFLTGRGFVRNDGTAFTKGDFVAPSRWGEAKGELQMLAPGDAIFEVTPGLGEFETMHEISSAWVPRNEKWIYGGLEALGMWPARSGAAVRQARMAALLADYGQQGRATLVTVPSAYQRLGHLGQQAPLAKSAQGVNWWTDPGRSHQAEILDSLLRMAESGSPVMRQQAAVVLEQITGQRPPMPGLDLNLSGRIAAMAPDRRMIAAMLAAPVAGLGTTSFAPLVAPPPPVAVVRAPDIAVVQGPDSAMWSPQTPLIPITRSAVNVPESEAIVIAPGVATQPQFETGVLAQPGVMTRPWVAAPTAVKSQVEPKVAMDTKVATRAQPNVVPETGADPNSPATTQPAPVVAPDPDGTVPTGIPHPDVVWDPAVTPASPVVITPRVVDHIGRVVSNVPGQMTTPNVMLNPAPGYQLEPLEHPDTPPAPATGHALNPAVRSRVDERVNRRRTRVRRRPRMDQNVGSPHKDQFIPPNRHPAKVTWQDAGVVHTLDLHTNDQTVVRALVPTDAPAHETFAVTEWASNPAPVRIIDLPGRYEAIVGPAGPSLRLDRQRRRSVFGQRRVL